MINALYQRLPSARLLNILGLLACAGGMAFALYLQQVKGLHPCPLCIFQRVAMIGAGLVMFIAALHNPGVVGQRIYAVLTGLSSVAGAGVAIRHIWIQHLPADQVPSCGPGLNYMLQVFPLQKVVDMVLRGSGECAEVHWRFLGLNIPEWALLAFIGLIALALVQLFRPRNA